MEDKNVILEISLHKDGALEIRMGDDERVNPLMLVGIIEQLKHNILAGLQVEKLDKSAKYDA